MRALAAIQLCVLLVICSCGRNEPAPPGSPPEPPAQAASDVQRGAEDGPQPPVRVIPRVEGVPSPLQIREASNPGGSALGGSFLLYMSVNGLFVCEAVEQLAWSGRGERWRLRVTTVLRQLKSPLEVGQTTPVHMPEGVVIERGDRVVLLGNWHRTGLNCIGCWPHSEELVAGIQHLHASLQNLYDAAALHYPERGTRGIAEGWRWASLYVCRVLQPDTSRPERGPGRWLVRIEEAIRGHKYGERDTFHVPASITPGFQSEESRIVMVSGHLPNRRVIGWWPCTPEGLALIKDLVAAVPDR